MSIQLNGSTFSLSKLDAVKFTHQDGHDLTKTVAAFLSGIKVTKE